ncbi:type VII secretion-associated protein [Mycolicibacterium rhodesiae]|uniref:Type VII secretion-associated protein n=1 Tax=Mycolicibacterium rhodesiae TaxID=36814 RepID=A0A1X0IMP2_MYCRH|nr:type VII secretion-associated protein [Mycolicibacterium rhodesiae]MCV7347306.1 type VII secretion-associated protein [Mycolicibacterium rhodesiae]ORB49553.1 type VII secretion-associated protein [Mycolicibacterium rhodesiae]
MTVLEVGPALVTRLTPRPQRTGEQELVMAALAGIDDTVVLFRERPVAVADLWRKIFADSVEERCETMTVVHPSWWAHHRVSRLVDAAATVATEVLALPRAAMLAAGEAATVIEIADEFVAVICDGRDPVTRIRPDHPLDLAEIIETPDRAAVLIDAPPGVSGAAEYAESLRTALCRRGKDARMVRMPAIPDPSEPKSTVEPGPAPRRQVRGAAAVAAGMALTLCAIGMAAVRTGPAARTPDGIYIVEGRVTLRIPPDWVVTRVTAGPGSRRVQASSPADSNTALHITQSYSPEETLDQAAATLSKAIAEQPRGVFVDFNPADRRGGRPAVTYREVRIAREIRWAVIHDGSTRISIGCQTAQGRLDSITEPCEQAIESAHEISGTGTGS